MHVWALGLSCEAPTALGPLLLPGLPGPHPSGSPPLVKKFNIQKLAEVEIGRSRIGRTRKKKKSWPKSKLADVDRALCVCVCVSVCLCVEDARLRPIRLRPISTSASFFSSSVNSTSGNSTSGNFDFGQFRLRPIFGR